ncbi:MAG: hypothetical protein KKG47_01920 [Proteobacteria bacterium]|nr:hypothetical protein [Pseudomonadota bacterium]
MSKQAVLVAYGPPPEQGTISTEANQWTSWQSRFDRRGICFNEENKLLSVCPTGIKGQGKNVIESFGRKIRGLLGGDEFNQIQGFLTAEKP